SRGGSILIASTARTRSTAFRGPCIPITGHCGASLSTHGSFSASAAFTGALDAVPRRRSKTEDGAQLPGSSDREGPTRKSPCQRAKGPLRRLQPGLGFSRPRGEGRDRTLLGCALAARAPGGVGLAG